MLVAVHDHAALSPGDAALLGFIDLKMKARHAKLSQLPLQMRRVCADVQKGAQRHIAADACKTVKI